MKIDKHSPFGYVTMPDGRTHVSRLNGGERRRSQLAYLIAQAAKIEKRDAAIAKARGN